MSLLIIIGPPNFFIMIQKVDLCLHLFHDFIVKLNIMTQHKPIIVNQNESIAVYSGTLGYRSSKPYHTDNNPVAKWNIDVCSAKMNYIFAHIENLLKILKWMLGDNYAIFFIDAVDEQFLSPLSISTALKC